MARTAIEIIRSLVSDVEAMKCAMPKEISPEVGMEKAWFGQFEDGLFDIDGYSIRWYNLDVLINEAKEFLSQEIKRDNQLWNNCEWLIIQTDKIHDLLCPTEEGTWQQRAEQAVRAAERLKKK